MQRELEQNSKDCRILQFKLRKLERQREHLLTENSILANRCKQDEDGNDDSLTSNLRRTYEEFPEMHSEGKVTRRSKELESELRIAKEVSVRLHNELEFVISLLKVINFLISDKINIVGVMIDNILLCNRLSEDKRYKLEDEVFYYKEKVRELQTQNKWREGRNKSEQSTKSGPSEKPMTGDSGMSRELRDVLEREADLKDQVILL
jgi:hypothetical protein